MLIPLHKVQLNCKKIMKVNFMSNLSCELFKDVKASQCSLNHASVTV